MYNKILRVYILVLRTRRHACHLGREILDNRKILHPGGRSL